MYTVKDIVKRMTQDEATKYLEKFQFNDHPVWMDWIRANDVYHVNYNSIESDLEFEDDIRIIAIPVPIVEILSEIESIKFMNLTPTISESTKYDNNKRISLLENRIWELSYRYHAESYGKHDIYMFWVWNNGYFHGIYKGKLKRNFRDLS